MSPTYQTELYQLDCRKNQYDGHWGPPIQLANTTSFIGD